MHSVEQLAAAGGPRLAFDTTWQRYRQQLFTALAWWSGRLGQPPDAPKMQPPETSLEFIRRITIAIDDLDALDSFSEPPVVSPRCVTASGSPVVVA